VRSASGEEATEEVVDDNEFNNKWVIPSKARQSDAAKQGSSPHGDRRGSIGMAFMSSSEVAAEVGEDGEDHESESASVTKEQFSEAILREWRERMDEVGQRNKELEDKDDFTRYRHPSIANFAKGGKGLAPAERPSAAESRTESASLNAVRKRFAADDDVEFDFPDTKASRELIDTLKPYRAKYEHLFEDGIDLRMISKVEIDYCLRK